MTRPQRGYLYKAFGAWHVRYRENVWQQDGSTKRVQVSRRIASLSECPRKSDAQRRADEIMHSINTDLTSSCSTMPLVRFGDDIYLPYVKSQKRASTYRGYRHIWNKDLKPRLNGVLVREIRTWDAERLMRRIAAESDLSHSTLKHVKSVLSAIFAHAKRCGAINGVNPIQDVSIPKGRESEETYAYSLEEIYRMLDLLPDPAATVLATAAFTGLRKVELRGLRWENLAGDEIQVTHSVWNRYISDPKTRASKAPVPVIAPLLRFLERHRVTMGNPQSGWVFVSGNGSPLHLDNLVRREIRPLLEKAKVKWHGWHAFRRGLATNLQRLGVPIKVAQLLLRQADFATAANYYVKAVGEDAREAMQRLESVCNERAMKAFEASNVAVVN
ncbi:MAG: tyrosine-type recombinase/integrase [Candidatus Sulfotelmatobacter sp.]